MTELSALHRAIPLIEFHQCVKFEDFLPRNVEVMAHIKVFARGRRLRQQLQQCRCRGDHNN